MPASKKSSKTAKKKSSSKNKSTARKKSSRSPKKSGPLIDVARKIGTKLGEVNVAVRERMSKFRGGEPSGDQ